VKSGSCFRPVPKDLREELLQRGRLDLLYAFQNEKRVFIAAHHAYKQAAVVATRGGRTVSFRARFRMGVGDSPEAHEIPNDLLRNDSAAMVFTLDDLWRNSPKSLGLVELRSPRDLSIFRKIYDHSFRIGDNASGWEISYTREFDMTNDTKLFPPLEDWESKGFRPDLLGRWIGPEDEVALPVYEGRMIGSCDFWAMSWVSGKGRTAVWKTEQADGKCIRPQYLIHQSHCRSVDKFNPGLKIVHKRITAATNARSMVACFVTQVACGDTSPTLSLTDFTNNIALSSVLNTFAFDFVTRPRIGGLHLDWHLLAELPIPDRLQDTNPTYGGLVRNAFRLSAIHRRFAPEWLKLKHLYPELGSKEWKLWWAVTEADRLRLRVEIDALCADLYGLDPDDFDWIVRDDPTDPKGFYRVDRQLPFQERLTGLAAAAFRALKEGKWSAESAASLSNDEFFDLLGIPELTNAKAAHAKGLPGPLIEKRDGCHVWKPENFPKDDPRHGWTWNDCWKDAVAILGSEDAVRRYVEEEPKTAEPSHDEQPFRLQAKKPTPSQGKLF